MSKHVEKGLLGVKLGMTQLFDENDRATAVTVVEAGPCIVLQKKRWLLTATMPSKSVLVV